MYPAFFVYKQPLLTPHVSTATQDTHGMRSFDRFGRTGMKARRPQWISEEQKRAIALCERSITTNAGDLNVNSKYEGRVHIVKLSIRVQADFFVLFVAGLPSYPASASSSLVLALVLRALFTGERGVKSSGTVM